MLGYLAFVLGVLVVAGLLFVGASLLMGRGEGRPPAEADRSPVELPDDRPVTGDDVRALRISVAFRGYRMTEVDWLLDQFAQALDERDAEIASLRARVHPTEGAGPKEQEESTTPDVVPAADGPPAEDGGAHDGGAGDPSAGEEESADARGGRADRDRGTA